MAPWSWTRSRTCLPDGSKSSSVPCRRRPPREKTGGSSYSVPGLNSKPSAIGFAPRKRLTPTWKPCAPTGTNARQNSTGSEGRTAARVKEGRGADLSRFEHRHLSYRAAGQLRTPGEYSHGNHPGEPGPAGGQRYDPPGVPRP